MRLVLFWLSSLGSVDNDLQWSPLAVRYREARSDADHKLRTRRRYATATRWAIFSALNLPVVLFQKLIFHLLWTVCPKLVFGKLRYSSDRLHSSFLLLREFHRSLTIFQSNQESSNTFVAGKTRDPGWAAWLRYDRAICDSSTQYRSQTVASSENWEPTEDIGREGVTFLPVRWTSDQNSYFQESDFEKRMRRFWRYLENYNEAKQFKFCLLEAKIRSQSSRSQE
jgi:hypothetical protein